MNQTAAMHPEYLALAKERAAAMCRPHMQVEEFGYDFREWVSPYTKGAHSLGGIALVLQDWASAEGLAGGPDADIQLYGRARNLRTNVLLEELLNRIFNVGLAQVYATNAFPFVKAGSMSAQLRLLEIVDTVSRFAAKELKLASPSLVLALGGLPHAAMCRVGINCVRLPHPAARIGTIDKHEAAWRAALGKF